MKQSARSAYRLLAARCDRNGDPVELQLPILLDEQGQPFPPQALPCHRYAVPYTPWDEDALPRHQEQAAGLCRSECPARLACGRQLLRFYPYASGVWAGFRQPKHPEWQSPEHRHHLPDEAERYVVIQ